jgi:AraC family transcriptional regulator of adaptative response/methylated-DNA-[protein]-cysteine methyltransferase
MAEAGGYRPCRRCRPGEIATPGDAAGAVRRACDALAARPAARWTVAALARAGGTSVSGLQRGFRRALGLSPRDYVAACRRRRFLDSLRNGHRVTDAIYEAGYGSPSRVYGGVKMPGMTPATYGRGGAGATIAWATTATRIGRVLVAATEKGLCFVCIGSTDADVASALRAEFPKAVIADRPSRALDRYLDAVRHTVAGERWSVALPLDIRGTAFQWRVWRALTSIPPGETRSYRDVAASIGQPTAVRAVARACATNPVALVVPCHRVVAADGSTGGYRWGTGRKEKLLRR